MYLILTKIPEANKQSKNILEVSNMNIQTDNREFYICYSPRVFKFLHIENNIIFIVCGLHEKTYQKFWLFKKTDELKKLLEQYHKENQYKKQYE